MGVRQLAEQIDYPEAKLYSISLGRVKRLKDELVERILARYPQYSRTWLLTGEGPMCSDGAKYPYSAAEISPEPSSTKGMACKMLRCILTDLGLEVKQLADELDYPASKLYDIQRGRTKQLKNELVGRILAHYPQYSRTWLLTGEGAMHTQRLPSECSTNIQMQDRSGVRPAPVGTGTLIEGQYVVPEFIAAGAEVMLRLSGNALAPKYSNGDILACRRVYEMTFIQWGKVYVIETQQGIIVRHIFEHPTAPDQFLCRSDNSAYPPFAIPLTEIRSLYIVLGAIVLE